MYPVGIPALYAVILRRKRDLLNPRRNSTATSEYDGTGEIATGHDSAGGAGNPLSLLPTASRSQSNKELSPQELQEFNERVRARRDHPELIPTVFLWKTFGEDSDIQYLEYLFWGRLLSKPFILFLHKRVSAPLVLLFTVLIVVGENMWAFLGIASMPC